MAKQNNTRKDLTLLILGAILGYVIGYLLPYHLPPSISMTIPWASYDPVSHVHTVRINFTNNGLLSCNIRVSLTSLIAINFTGNTSDQHFVCYNNGVSQLSRSFFAQNLTFNFVLQPGTHNCVLLHINDAGGAFNLTQPRRIQLLANASNTSYSLSCQD